MPFCHMSNAKGQITQKTKQTEFVWKEEWYHTNSILLQTNRKKNQKRGKFQIFRIANKQKPKKNSMDCKEQKKNLCPFQEPNKSK